MASHLFTRSVDFILGDIDVFCQSFRSGPGSFAHPNRVDIDTQFDSDVNPLPPADGKISQAHTSGVFLEKPGLLKEALQRSELWNSNVPGSLGHVQVVQRVSTLEKSLLKLKEEQAAAVASELMGTGRRSGRDVAAVNPNDDGRLIVTNVVNNGDTAIAQINDHGVEFEEFSSDQIRMSLEVEAIAPNVQTVNEKSPGIAKQGESKDPVVVFIRHGRTSHNNLQLFTGWEDPPLAPDGVEDAKNAGRLLKMHGFEFDVVYTSWLTRAIETACKCTNISFV